MASEPLSGERNDAVKMSETSYPTNGSGKNLAKNTGVKYTFCDYPTPDSSLSLIFTASLRSPENGSLAITSFENDRQVFTVAL